MREDVVSPYVAKDVDPRSSHARIVGLLAAALGGERAPRVLDVGCGPGILAEVAARRAPDFAREVRWVGIDRDPAALHTAACAGVEGHVVDLDVMPEPPVQGPFAAVVFADVLEHLPSPDLLLARWLPLLCDPTTVVIVSLPNVANLAVRASLLAGRFHYADRGILDRAHLRFFTRRTGHALLEGAGLRVVRTAATPVPANLLGGEWLGRGRAASTLQQLLAVPTAVWPTLLGYQFVFEARYEGRRG